METAFINGLTEVRNKSNRLIGYIDVGVLTDIPWWFPYNDKKRRPGFVILGVGSSLDGYHFVSTRRDLKLLSSNSNVYIKDPNTQ